MYIYILLSLFITTLNNSVPFCQNFFLEKMNLLMKET